MVDAIHTLNIIIKVTDKATRQVKRVKKKVTEMDKSVKKVNKSMGGFSQILTKTLLGVGLSFLFTGMAIKRFFEGILRSLTSTFLTVMGETSQQVQQVNRLKAAWEFLKFRIMSALVASGLWDKVIDKLKEIIDRTIEWVNANPKATAELVKTAAIISVLATMMMVLGQTLLGILGIATLIWGMFKLITFLISGTTLAAVTGLIFGLLAVVAIAILLRAKFGSWSNVLKSLINTVINILLFKFNLLVKIASVLADVLSWIARKAGMDTIADGLSRASNAADDLLNKMGEITNLELDESVMPDTTLQGLLGMVGLEGIAELLSSTQPTTTTEEGGPANSGEDINENLISLNDTMQELNESIQTTSPNNEDNDVIAPQSGG